MCDKCGGMDGAHTPGCPGRPGGTAPHQTAASLATVILAILIATLAAACSPTPTAPAATPAPATPPPAAFDLPVGTAFTDARAASAADVTLTAAEARRNQGADFLIATVRYTGTAGAFAYHPYDWRFRAADGTETPMSFIDVPNPLGDGTVRAGETVTGLVGFEVPPDTHGVVFYAPDGADLASWKI